jgi:SAM-dependent methyltransferase
MTDSSQRYFSSWESYWRTITGAPDEVFWDADPANAAQQDFPRFAPFCDPRLPLLDLGCGNGTQTRFLAQHWGAVIGVDIAPAAVEIARATNAAANIVYRVLDLLSAEDVARLHADIGAANIYMRTVLHQLAPQDQPGAVQGVEQLLGATGTLYLIELSAAAEAYFGELREKYGLPPALARVFQHKITPGLLHEQEIATLFPPERFVVLNAGESVIRTTYRTPAGEYAQVPAFYRVLRRRAE